MEMTSMSMRAAIPLRSTPSINVAPPFSASTSSFCSANVALFRRASLSLTAPTAIRKKKGLTCNALFGLGVPELVVIAGVAALVFGPKKLPEVGRSIGKTVKSFQQAAKEFESEIKKDPESPGEGPSEEKPVALSEQEEKKQGMEVSSSKDSV
ncbi:sec-independent protein translocase protein TATA, chloroplastic [Arachis stenosperma]|uniref:sec-independent protein translocase protein TATA, chloroplastic n=1 Tax=Arachis stenosperma TaxID=217475 RepID=UPI0025AC8736|nr:sec-independent protein translocase protein TATA, chloroplastic [Arachis stenosperma]